MNEQQAVSTRSLLYYRLIALWVLNEAMLGGIIHGFKIPVSGLVVGSCAVICICLIAWYVPVRGAILQATVIVAIFKMMLSPQAPPPAYIAVFFQGLLGELLFFNRKFFKLSCFLLAILSLAESGLQRILVLTIIYGNDLWKVINDAVNGLTKQTKSFNYSQLIAGGYVVLHLIAGLLVGWWASMLPAKISKWTSDSFNKIVIGDKPDTVIPAPKKKRKKLKKGLFVIWILLLLVYIQSYFNMGTPLLPSHISLKILLRSMLIVLSWYFVVAPLLRQLFHHWLQKRKSKSQMEVGNVLEVLPTTQKLIAESWNRSARVKGWRRFIDCARLILVNALNPVVAGRFFILTGPVQTGKTTSLVKWSEQKNNIYGVLTPIVNGKRTFMDVHARHLFDMEAVDEEKDRLFIGRFVFSKAGFDKAIKIIRNAKQQEGWLIIDEVGPMELRGDGFREVVKEVIASGNERQKVVLVVREGLVDKVKDSFHLEDVVVISQISALS